MINLFFKLMRKVVLSLITLFTTQGDCSDFFADSLVEIKTGYFFFTDSTMRNIYDKGGFDLQLCASCPLQDLSTRWSLNAYGAFEYFECSGHSLNDHQKTSVWAIPFNFGLQPVYAFNAKLNYYVTIGPRYFYIHQHNDTSYLYKNKSRNGLGFFVNTGLKYALRDHLVIDIFGEYSYAKTHFHNKRAAVYTTNFQIGGLTFGGGVGYQF